MNFIKKFKGLKTDDAEQRYKFHRVARYLLALPMVFLLVRRAAGLIGSVL